MYVYDAPSDQGLLKDSEKKRSISGNVRIVVFRAGETYSVTIDPPVTFELLSRYLGKRPTSTHHFITNIDGSMYQVFNEITY